MFMTICAIALAVMLVLTYLKGKQLAAHILAIIILIALVFLLRGIYGS